MFSGIKRMIGVGFLGVAVLCAGYGVKCLFTDTDAKSARVVKITDNNVHPENEGKMVLMTGKLTYDGTLVQDADTGVSVKAPILQRTTKMRQYTGLGSPNEKKKRMSIVWEEKHQSTFTDTTGRKYSNPDFPQDVPKSAVFACDLTMNNGNLKIDKEFTKALSYKSYVNFKEKNANGYNGGMVGVGQLPAAKMAPKYQVKNASYFLPYQGGSTWVQEPRDKRRGIGDIEITYKAYKFKSGMPEFTIIGLQQNGKLVKAADTFFFDYKVENLQELQKEVRSSNRNAMLGAFAFALILGSIGYYLFKKD